MKFITLKSLLVLAITSSIFLINLVSLRHHSHLQKHKKAHKKIWPFNKKEAELDFESHTYQSMPAVNKMRKLWDHIKLKQTPYGWYNAINTAGIFFENMNVTFDTQSDIFLGGRKKLIHSVGTVVKAKFIAEHSSPYTGVFKGCPEVLLRLSAATKPDNSKTTAQGAYNNFKPGGGIKFLRNGVASANLVFMKSLRGQDSWNFFKYEFTNHVTTPSDSNFVEKKLVKKFETASKYTGQIGLKDIAEYDHTGKKESTVKYPYKLIFKPTSTVSSLNPDHFTRDFTEQLKAIPSNVHMYDVYALDSPDAKKVKIGRIETVGKSITSEFGDQYLFFRHSRMDYDFNDHHDWQSLELLQNPKFKRLFVEKYGFEHP